MPTKRPIHQYAHENLEKALEAVRAKEISIREAERRFGVPRGTIQDRIHGRVPEGPRKMGPSTVLSKGEEKELEEWIITLAKLGFPRNKKDVLATVARMVADRQTPFTNGVPGDKWYTSFLARHPIISQRMAESLTKGRAIITKEFIRSWFSELQNFLSERGCMDILLDSRRMLNGDETCFSMDPKTGKVLAPRGWKNVYDVKMGNEKDNLTVLLVFNAAGDVIPPMIIYPYVVAPRAVVKNVPPTWVIGLSESGWMKSDTFYEYLTGKVDPWLTENIIPRPVLLFVNGHKSHLTIPTSKFCDENGIILYTLPPNTTHMMQPADVSVFKPLKSGWKQTVKAWQSKPENINSYLTKAHFAQCLEIVLNNPNIPKSIKNGFEACGLFPFNPENVDYSKCIQNGLERLENCSNILVRDESFKTTIQTITSLREKLEAEGVDVTKIINVIKDCQESLSNAEEGISRLDTSSVFTENSAQGLDSTIGDVSDDIQESSTQFVVREEVVSLLDSQLQQELDLNHLDNGADQQEGVDAIQNPPIIDISNAGNPSSRSSAADQVLVSINQKSVTSFSDVTQQISFIDEYEAGPSVNSSDVGQSESSNDTATKLAPTSSPFGPHFFWPGPIKSQRKRLPKEKIPSAVSSEAWRKFYETKDREKEDKEKRKKNRKLKQDRKNLRTATKKQETPPRSTTLCPNCEEDVHSDTDDDEMISVGCETCSAWYHLKCTPLAGLDLDDDEFRDQRFLCDSCSTDLVR